MGLHIDELDFDLDESLIAVRPAAPRESARLMVLTLPPADVDDSDAVDDADGEDDEDGDKVDEER